MKYFILAGEASGDAHAARLIQSLQAQDPAATFAGTGGDLMANAGCHLYRHYREMAFMGVTAVLANLGKIHRNMQIAREALLAERPNALILIDYPNFNLAMAEFCRKHLPETRIIYYIPPKIWAWRKWRVHRIARVCDLILGIFPFEPNFYQCYGYDCTYVGNPTVEAIDKWQQLSTLTVHSSNLKSQISQLTAHSSIALLPGSRKGEIKHCLPIMLAAAQEVNKKRFPDNPLPIRIAAAPGIDDSFYASLLTPDGSTQVPDWQLTRSTYELLSHARAAIVNSGTATLETALIGCPQTAVYHITLGWLLNPLRHVLFSIPQFTLVNIIADKPVIRELLAADFTWQNVQEELTRLLTDEDYKATQRAEYETIRQILGTQSASTTAARHIINVLS